MNTTVSPGTRIATSMMKMAAERTLDNDPRKPILLRIRDAGHSSEFVPVAELAADDAEVLIQRLVELAVTDTGQQSL